MKDNLFDVSIIIISWKMRDLLETCLNSLYEFTINLNFELVVIDNNSADGTADMVKNKFPNAKLIINQSNKGVAPARNQGLKIAKGKYVLILDADMKFNENSIIQLFQFMENTSECGMVGCKLVDSNEQLQYSCKRYPTILSFLFRRLEQFNFIANSKTLRFHTMQDWNHSSIRKVDYLIGACQFIRRDVINKIGYYDQNIFYGPEDIDYCLRVWNAGWSVCYYPDTKIIHYEQRITKKKIFSIISLKHILGILYLYKKYNCKIKISSI